MFNFFKRAIEKVFNCRIYRNSLPRGTDLCYDIKRLGDAYALSRVMDVGANIGQTATLFATEFPNARVFSFEPINETFQALERNTQRFSNVNCFQLALGASKSKQEIHLKSISRVNSLVPELNVDEKGGHGREIITVDTVDNFCAEQEVNFLDLLKIDTEGFDLEVIKGAEGMLISKKVRFVLAEVGFDNANKQHVLFENLRQHLLARGFVLFGLYEQTNDWSGKPFLLYCNALFINNEYSAINNGV